VTVEKIQDTIDKDIRPALQSHGGDVEFLGYDDATKTVRIRLTGACGSCPFAQETLRLHVEATLKKAFPEISKVARA